MRQTIEETLKAVLSKLLLSLPERSPIRSLFRKFYIESILSSRLVEYPLIFRHINLPKKIRILDVGCCYSLLSIQLASLDYEVYGIDIEDYPYTHPNFKFSKQDIIRTDFPDNFFECIIAVSTLEHIGMRFSFNALKSLGGTKDLEGDRKAIKEIMRILKKDGKILITLPFGKWHITPSERVYDHSHLTELLSGFKIEYVEYFIAKNGYWAPVSLEEAEKFTSSGIWRAFVFIKAKKIG